MAHAGGLNRPKSRTSAYRGWIEHLDKVELMGELFGLMERKLGQTLTLDEAEDCKYLMERLLELSQEKAFRAHLQESLTVLAKEISRIKN